MITVTLYTGQVLTFPDGTPESVIKAAAKAATERAKAGETGTAGTGTGKMDLSGLRGKTSELEPVAPPRGLSQDAELATRMKLKPKAPAPSASTPEPEPVPSRSPEFWRSVSGTPEPKHAQYLRQRELQSAEAAGPQAMSSLGFEDRETYYYNPTTDERVLKRRVAGDMPAPLDPGYRPQSAGDRLHDAYEMEGRGFSTPEERAVSGEFVRGVPSRIMGSMAGLALPFQAAEAAGRGLAEEAKTLGTPHQPLEGLYRGVRQGWQESPITQGAAAVNRDVVEPARERLLDAANQAGYSPGAAASLESGQMITGELANPGNYVGLDMLRRGAQMSRMAPEALARTTALEARGGARGIEEAGLLTREYGRGAAPSELAQAKAARSGEFLPGAKEPLLYRDPSGYGGYKWKGVIPDAIREVRGEPWRTYKSPEMPERVPLERPTSPAPRPRSVGGREPIPMEILGGTPEQQARIGGLWDYASRRYPTIASRVREVQIAPEGSFFEPETGVLGLGPDAKLNEMMHELTHVAQRARGKLDYGPTGWPSEESIEPFAVRADDAYSRIPQPQPRRLKEVPDFDPAWEAEQREISAAEVANARIELEPGEPSPYDGILPFEGKASRVRSQSGSAQRPFASMSDEELERLARPVLDRLGAGQKSGEVVPFPGQSKAGQDISERFSAFLSKSGIDDPEYYYDLEPSQRAALDRQFAAQDAGPHTVPWAAYLMENDLRPGDYAAMSLPDRAKLETDFRLQVAQKAPDPDTGLPDYFYDPEAKGWRVGDDPNSPVYAKEWQAKEAREGFRAYADTGNDNIGSYDLMPEWAKPARTKLQEAGVPVATVRRQVPRWAVDEADANARYRSFLKRHRGEEISPEDLPFALEDLPLTRWDRSTGPDRIGKFWSIGDSVQYRRSGSIESENGAVSLGRILDEGGDKLNTAMFTPQNPLVIVPDFSASMSFREWEENLARSAAAAGHDAVILFSGRNEVMTLPGAVLRPRESPAIRFAIENGIDSLPPILDYNRSAAPASLLNRAVPRIQEAVRSPRRKLNADGTLGPLSDSPFRVYADQPINPSSRFTWNEPLEPGQRTTATLTRNLDRTVDVEIRDASGEIEIYKWASDDDLMERVDELKSQLDNDNDLSWDDLSSVQATGELPEFVTLVDRLGKHFPDRSRPWLRVVRGDKPFRAYADQGLNPPGPVPLPEEQAAIAMGWHRPPGPPAAAGPPIVTENFQTNLAAQLGGPSNPESAAIADYIVKESDAVFKAIGPPQSWDTLEEMALRLGTTKDQFLSDASHWTVLSPEARLRMLYVIKGNEQKISGLQGKLAQGAASDLEKVELLRLIEARGDLIKLGAKTGSAYGRALNSLKMEARLALDDSGILRQKLYSQYKDQLDAEKPLMDALARLDPTNQEELQAFLRHVAKPKFREMLQEYWVASILSGPATHERNLIGNAVNAVLENAVVRPVAAGWDAARGGGASAREVFLRETPAAVVGLTRGIRQGARRGLEVLKRGYDADSMTGKLYPVRSAFARSQNKVVREVVGPIATMPLRLLAASDAVFKSMNFSAELYAQAARAAAKEGLSGAEFAARAADLIANPTDEMMDAADSFALKATFNDPASGIGAAIINLRDQVPAVGGFIIPFVKIADRLMVRGFEYSPIGAVKAMRAATRAESVDLAARASIGSVVLAYAASLAMEGRLTAGAPTDEAEKAAFFGANKQAWSVRTDDGTWIPYGGLQPIGTPFAIAATAWKGWSENQEAPDVEKLGHAAAEIGVYVTDQSYMDGLSKFMDAIGGSEQERGRAFSDLATNTLWGFAPYSGMTRTVARAIDPRVIDAEAIKDRLAQNVPGVSLGMDARLTPWGEDVVPVGGRLRAVLAPGSIVLPSQEHINPLDQELGRLGMPLGYVGKTLSDKMGSGKSRGSWKLSQEEWYFYQQTAGRTTKQLLERLMGKPGYQLWDDEKKREEVEAAIGKAREYARLQAVRRKRGLGWN